MHKQGINNLIASGFGIGFIGKSSKLFSLILGFTIAILIKEIQYAEIIFPVIILLFIVIGNHSIKSCINSYEEAPQWVVIQDIIGILITLNFYSNSILLNLFAFVTFIILNIFSPILDSLKIKTKYLNRSLFKGVFIGVLTNSFVYLILLITYLSKN